jgi:putative ABC transport system permease protein
MGRTFSGGDFYTASIEDGLWSVGDVVVLDYGFWLRHFGGSRDALGSRLSLNNKRVLVVGVMPEGFGAMWRDADVYLPWILPPDFWSERAANVLPMLARRGQDISQASAASEVSTIYARLATEYPETNEVLTGTVVPLRERYGASTRTAIALSAGALMVLVVACANLAGLLATRARKRVGELALRRALGATRARIVRQLVIESAAIVLIGGVIGVVAARGILHWVSLPMLLPFSPELSLPVLGFSFLLLAGTALALGLAPAWLLTREELSAAIDDLARSRSTHKVSSAFVVVQVAVALGLVSTSALLLRSFDALERESMGFDPERVQSLYLRLPETRYRSDDAQREFRRRALEAVRSVPGVVSAATASHLPTTPMSLNLATAIDGRPLPRGTLRAAPVFVSRDLLRTLRIPILRGRHFDERDSKQSPWVIVINERMAREFWPDEDSVGKSIRLDYAWAPDAPLTVIGVVADVKQERVGAAVRPAFYILHEQFPQEWFYFVLRTRGAPDPIVGGVRERLAAVDPNLPLSDFETMDQRVAASLADHRARARLFTLYASAGLLLATLGLYGTLASLVSLRTGELVIRMTLGATRADVARLVLAFGARQLAAGLALGLALALIAGRFVESLLFGVHPADGVSLVVTLVVLGGAGVAAFLVPTYRAVHLNLASRLRGE